MNAPTHATSPPTSNPDSLAPAPTSRLGLFAAILLLLNLQLDGFRLSHDPLRNQLLLLPITALFCVLLLALLFPRLRCLRPLTRATQRVSPATAHTLLLIFLAGAAALFVKSARFYAAFGYRLHPLATALVFAIPFTALAILRYSPRKASAQTLFPTILLAFIAISTLSISSFPLNPQRSDMLPLLDAANYSLAAGANPYHRYTLPSGTVFLTYLPATLLAYLPATRLYLDLRLINLACDLALALLLYRSLARPHRPAGAILLGLWLLSPYLLYRHDLYTPPHWLALIAALLLLHRRRVRAAALLFGLSIAMSQFSWVLFPFFLLHLWQSRRHRSPSRTVLGANDQRTPESELYPTRPSRTVLAAAAIALATAAVITLPFFLWSPHALLFGVLSHWHNTQVSTRPINLAFFAARLIGTAHLQLLQAITLLGLFTGYTLTRGCRTLSGCLQAMSLALAAFILLNVLIWGYFFLLLELLLLLYVFSSEGWLEPEGSASLP